MNLVTIVARQVRARQKLTHRRTATHFQLHHKYQGNNPLPRQIWSVSCDFSTMVRMFSDPSDCRRVETDELPGIPNYSYVCFDQLSCSKSPHTPVWVSQSKGKKGNRGKLSCRAKIMHPEGDDRIRVQYSNGKTFLGLGTSYCTHHNE